MNIELDSLVLTRYSEEKHKRLKENFESGESHSDFIYQSAFVVEDLGVPVGYLFISNRIRDEVFLEYAVLKEYRGMGYGSDIVRQTTDYLFQNHNIKDIRLDIDPSNKNSINTAEACGYTLDEDEFASRNYTGRMQFVQDSTYYVSKRR